MADPLSAVAGAAAAIKAVTEMVAGLRGGKNKPDSETAKVLLEIEARLLATKKEVLDLEQKTVQLEDENSQLRAKIRSHEERAADRQHYKHMKAGAAGYIVVVDDRNPNIPNCSACCAKYDRLVPLHPMSRDFRALGSGTHFCPHCKIPSSLGERATWEEQ
jgi:hypothetical protein